MTRWKAALTRRTSDPEEPSTVVNLSGVALSEVETKLLLRGLSFCPTPHHINKEETLDGSESYFRCLHVHLKEFFLEEEEENN